VHVSPHEQHELPNSKGTANFILKFDKGSKFTASVSDARLVSFLCFVILAGEKHLMMAGTIQVHAC